MMGHREALKGIEEWNVFTGWRHLIVKYLKPGKTKKVKRMFNRRIRRGINQHLMDDVVE